jgi:hypothetical protein
LCKSLDDELGLVLLDGPVWALLNMKDPFAANDLSFLRLRDAIIHIKLLLSLHLIFLGYEPFESIRTSYGFIISLWLRGLSISKVGTMTVEGNVIAWVII